MTTETEDPWVYAVASYQDPARDHIRLLVSRHRDAGEGQHYDFQRLNGALDWESVLDADGRYIQFEDQADPLTIPSYAIACAPDITGDYLTKIAMLIEDEKVLTQFINMIGLRAR